jgi:solute carrier family 25 (adenine nucleotide translocator) protein 4/5/6/31
MGGPTGVPQKPGTTSKDILIDFLAGGTAGAISKTAVAPLERVKLLLQTQDVNQKITQGGKKYKGFGDCFIRCVREEGAISLWRGNWANVLRYFPTQALNFAFKERYQKMFANYNPVLNPYKFFAGNLFAGGMAGATGLLFVYPLDFARTRLGVDIGKSLNERQFKGMNDCIAKIYRADGIQGLYRGFAISVAGIFVYRAFYFGGYDAGKKFMFGDDPNPSILYRFLFAQFITSSSEFLAYPLDTIRRRLMMQSGRGDIIYRGTVDCARKIAVNEGLTAFFKGNLSNIYRSVGSSLVLVLYDEFKRWLLLAGQASYAK